MPKNLFEQLSGSAIAALAALVNSSPDNPGFTNTLRDIPPVDIPIGKLTVGHAWYKYSAHMLAECEKFRI